MDSTVVTAMAATLGSMVGASASIATAWITQRTQAVRANAEWKLHERDTLYREFITEASRLAVDALMHSLERPDQLVALYGILSRIRLIASDEVLERAEDCCRRIVELYGRPNMTPGQIHTAFEANELDLLKDFSLACRKELMAMSSTSYFANWNHRPQFRRAGPTGKA
jgi:hypothetical protein